MARDTKLLHIHRISNSSYVCRLIRLEYTLGTTRHSHSCIAGLIATCSTALPKSRRLHHFGSIHHRQDEWHIYRTTKTAIALFFFNSRHLMLPCASTQARGVEHSPVDTWCTLPNRYTIARYLVGLDTHRR